MTKKNVLYSTAAVLGTGMMIFLALAFVWFVDKCLRLIGVLQ